MFSFLPPHARNALCCSALPKEKDTRHGRFAEDLLIAFNTLVESASLIPPERNAMPGTEHGTVFCTKFLILC
jgi:hypothetical protein